MVVTQGPAARLQRQGSRSGAESGIRADLWEPYRSHRLICCVGACLVDRRIRCSAAARSVGNQRSSRLRRRRRHRARLDPGVPDPQHDPQMVDGSTASGTAVLRMECPGVAADRDPRPDSHVPDVDAASLRRRDHLRFLAVAVGALGLCALYALRGYFSSDFWEHAAVVRELSVRPLAPRHPLLAVDAPHAYASPYHLAVGLAARVTGAAP